MKHQTKISLGFAPVIDSAIEMLILGSFPGIASLGKKQYYGHPQNQFWRLVGAVIKQPLPDMDYPERLRTLLAHRIGLWDIIAACSRKGSLDSNIRNPANNDYSRVTDVAGKLKRVCFNGKAAASKAAEFAALGYETLALPSSSPAYTLSFEQKLKEWRRIAAPTSRPRQATRAANSGPVSPLHSSLFTIHG